jgi:hypothetical protein
MHKGWCRESGVEREEKGRLMSPNSPREEKDRRGGSSWELGRRRSSWELGKDKSDVPRSWTTQALI